MITCHGKHAFILPIKYAILVGHRLAQQSLSSQHEIICRFKISLQHTNGKNAYGHRLRIDIDALVRHERWRCRLQLRMA